MKTIIAILNLFTSVLLASDKSSEQNLTDTVSNVQSSAINIRYVNGLSLDKECKAREGKWICEKKGQKRKMPLK